MSGAVDFLRQARAQLAAAARELADHPPADPGEVAQVRAEAAQIEEGAQWCAARAVAGRGGALTITFVDVQGRLRVVGG